MFHTKVKEFTRSNWLHSTATPSFTQAYKLFSNYTRGRP